MRIHGYVWAFLLLKNSLQFSINHQKNVYERLYLVKN